MIVLPHRDPVLVDLEALAYLTKRSRHTIRLRCTVVQHYGRHPLYDLDASLDKLATIPTRRRDRTPAAS